MQLTEHGTVRVNGHLARFTTGDGWMVSRYGKILGYVDTLAEVEALIAKNLERVRKHLAMVTQQAIDRKADAEAETAMIQNATKK